MSKLRRCPLKLTNSRRPNCKRNSTYSERSNIKPLCPVGLRYFLVHDTSFYNYMQRKEHLELSFPLSPLLQISTRTYHQTHMITDTYQLSVQIHNQNLPIHPPV